MIVIPATAATTGIQTSVAAPTPSTYRRMIAMNPAAFGATASHATNGVFAASYVSGAHMWNGNAAILKPSPASSSVMPSTISGSPEASAGGIDARSVLPVTPNMNDMPYTITAEEAVPTRKNLSAASGAAASRLT